MSDRPAPSHPALLEPLRIGPLVARNRVVFGPHETNLGRRRSISDRHVAYYRRRAEGGAGVVVTEEASVHPSDWPMERAPLAAECGDGWAEVAAACHDEGALVLAAIGHAGGQGTSHWSQLPLWAPSGVPEVNTREVPKVMEAADVAAVVDGFAAAARLAVEAGCDGVEVNAGQHSLVRQFLSGLTNTRGDEWGQDRGRFAREVLTAVRAAVGPDHVVALRLSCDELAPWAGITPEAGAELAASFAAPAGDEPGRIDLLTVVRGSIFSVGATRPDGHTPPGFNLDLVRSVRAAVRAVAGDRVPVVAQGSLVDPDQAHAALVDGAADAVEMTRAQVADPLLVSRLADGTPERVRPCTLCNQLCQVRDNRNPVVSCVGEPFSGHETEDVPVRGRALRPVEVLVVGAGPAGLEAARVAALRGHRVRVAEREPEAGGALRTVARMPGRDRFAMFAGWLEAECRRLGVELDLGHEVTGDEAAAAAHLVIAAGGRNGERAYRCTRGAQVRSAAEALDDPAALPDGTVLVWDPIGGPVGVAAAELLVATGRTVHLATPDLIVGNELARSGDLAAANARLAGAGVVLHRRSLLSSVRKGRATLEDRFTGATTDVPAAVVVDAGHRLPDVELFDRVRAAVGHKPTRAGDCVAPRTVHEAVLEGRRAALDLG